MTQGLKLLSLVCSLTLSHQSPGFYFDSLTNPERRFGLWMEVSAYWIGILETDTKDKPRLFVRRNGGRNLVTRIVPSSYLRSGLIPTLCRIPVLHPIIPSHQKSLHIFLYRHKVGNWALHHHRIKNHGVQSG